MLQSEGASQKCFVRPGSLHPFAHMHVLVAVVEIESPARQRIGTPTSHSGLGLGPLARAIAGGRTNRSPWER
jgi:hypothetical protein